MSVSRFVTKSDLKIMKSADSLDFCMKWSESEGDFVGTIVASKYVEIDGMTGNVHKALEYVGGKVIDYVEGGTKQGSWQINADNEFLAGVLDELTQGDEIRIVFVASENASLRAVGLVLEEMRIEIVNNGKTFPHRIAVNVTERNHFYRMIRG